MRKDRRKSNNLAPKVFTIFIVCLIFFLGFITVKEIFNKSKLDKEIAELNQEIERLEHKQGNFLSLIDQYDDSFYVEQQARLKMNLKKPGEEVVVVKLNDVQTVSDEGAATVELGSDSENPAATMRTNPRRWWDYFFAPKITS